MYDQPKLSELIRFAHVDAGSTVIDVYPGDGDWTRLFSDIVGPDGRVYSSVPAEVAHFKNDPVGRMRALAKEPGRENVEVVSADLVAMPEVTQRADVLWLHLFYHDLHTELIQARGATACASAGMPNPSGRGVSLFQCCLISLSSVAAVAGRGQVEQVLGALGHCV
jgi:predicted methyltransferase